MTATATDLVREVVHAGGKLFPLDDGRLRVTAPEPLPEELVDRIRRHKPEVIALLTRPVSEDSGWDTEAATLIEWFLKTEPPGEPFEISKGIVIARPAVWWAALRQDIAAGPRGPRARYGALQQDLRRLASLIWGSEHGT